MATLFITSMGFSQNVNTGMGSIGTVDSWKVGTTIPLGNSYVIANSFPGLWETTSVSINTPKWISVSTGGKGSGQTDFIYEKKFTVPAGIMQLKCNFKIAADDVLKKIELIQPNSTKVNIGFTNTGNYKFTKLITDSLVCPVKGDWTLRVTVFCGDAKGTQGWTALLVSGNINFKEGKCPPPPCSCPKGWLASSTNEDGGVSADGKCKKLVCAPIAVLPPPNGTSIGNWGFTWGNEIWVWGTKENGGAPINCDATENNESLAIVKQKDENVGINPNINPQYYCLMGFEWKNGVCTPMPSRVYCNDGKKVIMVRVQGQLVNAIYTNIPCDERTWPGQGVDDDGTVVRYADVWGRELTESISKADKYVLNLIEISNLYNGQLPAKATLYKSYIQKQEDVLSLVLIYKTRQEDLVIITPLIIENEYIKISGTPKLLTLNNNLLLMKEIKAAISSSKKNYYVGHVTLLR